MSDARRSRFRRSAMRLAAAGLLALGLHPAAALALDASAPELVAPGFYGGSTSVSLANSGAALVDLSPNVAVRTPAGAWSTTLIGDRKCEGQAAMDAAGHGIALETCSEKHNAYVVASYYEPGGTWTKPVQVTRPSDDLALDQLAVARDGRAAAIVTAMVRTQRGPTQYSRSVRVLTSSNGRAWSKPSTVSRAGSGSRYGQIALGEDGTVAVSWADALNPADVYTDWRMVVRLRSAGSGAWGLLLPLPGKSSPGIGGRLQLGVAGPGRGWSAWTDLPGRQVRTGEFSRTAWRGVRTLAREPTGLSRDLTLRTVPTTGAKLVAWTADHAKPASVRFLTSTSDAAWSPVSSATTDQSTTKFAAGGPNLFLRVLDHPIFVGPGSGEAVDTPDVFDRAGLPLPATAVTLRYGSMPTGAALDDNGHALIVWQFEADKEELRATYGSLTSQP